jgi:acyl-CoA thioesterase-1
MGLDDPSLESWPGQLQALADSAGIPVDVRNAGVSGDTSAGGLRRLEWLLQDPPSVLIVELGANDGLRGLDLGALEDNLRSIVALTLEANAATRVFLAAMEAPPNLGASYTSRFREVFPRVAQDTGAGLIPFILDGVAGVPGMNQADAIHPTAEGHRRIARNAWEILEPAFRAAAEEGEGR